MDYGKALRMLRTPLHTNIKGVWLKLAKLLTQISVKLLAPPFLLLAPSVSTITQS